MPSITDVEARDRWNRNKNCFDGKSDEKLMKWIMQYESLTRLNDSWFRVEQSTKTHLMRRISRNKLMKVSHRCHNIRIILVKNFHLRPKTKDPSVHRNERDKNRSIRLKLNEKSFRKCLPSVYRSIVIGKVTQSEKNYIPVSRNDLFPCLFRFVRFTVACYAI